MKITRKTSAIKKPRRGANGAVLAAQNKAHADEFARQMRPILFKLMTSIGGRRKITPRALAEELNALGLPAFRDGKWHGATVRRLLVRLGPEFQQQVWGHTGKVLKQEFGTDNNGAVGAATTI